MLNFEDTYVTWIQGILFTLLISVENKPRKRVGRMFAVVTMLNQPVFACAWPLEFPNKYFISSTLPDFKANSCLWLEELSMGSWIGSGGRVKSGEDAFRARIVRLIRNERDPETALEELSTHYSVERPVLRMGLPKGERRALGCYVKRDKTIYISNQDYLYDPYVLIHEFYHHLRNVSGKHRGTERHAKEFAVAFLRSDSETS